MVCKRCPLRASPIFGDIPSYLMSLAQIAHPWNSTEDTPEFTGIPPNILLMSEIEGLKREIESLIFSTEHNIKAIIDSMVSQTKQIMEEILSNTEVLTSELKEVSVTNGSNIMYIVIED